MDVKLVVAFIGVLVSFVGLIISKEQKISDFRQEWIDRLRDDISELVGNLSLLSNAWLLVENEYKKDKKVGDTFLKENIVTIRNIDTLVSRSKLRLNPDKDKDLIGILDLCEQLTCSPRELTSKTFINNVNKLEIECHKVFKTEWQRVKKGEPIYKTVKLGIPIIFVIYLIQQLIILKIL